MQSVAVTNVSNNILPRMQRHDPISRPPGEQRYNVVNFLPEDEEATMFDRPFHSTATFGSLNVTSRQTSAFLLLEIKVQHSYYR